MEIVAKNERETALAARELAKRLRAPAVILLHGDLGAGKTVFARALIRTLCGDTALEVPSPTFTLVQTYEGPGYPIWHFDLYRLEDAEEIYELGWEDALSEGLVIVEWPERLGSLTPQSHLDIRLSNAQNKPESRIIEINETA